ncbi:MAG: zinc ABC transporter substrate-binding protein [Candidatus Andersenbacteria bacterium]|nr:zinc ABC transporter substrate-binding protein [Candidatus Andersenbacteria bacterium]
MSKKYLLPISVAALIGLAVGAIFFMQISRIPQDAESGQTGSLKIVSSIYPLAFFTQQIVGDLGTVTTITPAGAEPHEYELTSQDIARLEGADVVVLNGANLEPWAEKMTDSLRAQGVQVVEVSEGIATGTDPHIWLSPALAKAGSAKISKTIASVDPLHVPIYQKNTQALAGRLDALDASYRAGLASCERKVFVTSHAAFGYLAAEYGLLQVPIAGLSPETEPSGKQLADIARFVKQQGVSVIFFETLLSPKLSQTIARETGAAVMELNPLEGLTPDEVAAGKDYTSVMQHNLRNLQTALVCHQ